MRPKFKVGDRVLCTMGFEDNPTIRGKRGKVVELGELARGDDHKLYGVMFDCYIREGHSLDRSDLSQYHGRCWWVPSGHLQLIPKGVSK